MVFKELFFVETVVGAVGMCKSGKTPEKQWKSSVESFVEIIHIFMEHPKSYPQSKIKKFFAKNRPRSINSLSTAFSQVIVD